MWYSSEHLYLFINIFSFKIVSSLRLVECIDVIGEPAVIEKQFKYIIVVDFEATCWKVKWAKQEIIGKTEWITNAESFRKLRALWFFFKFKWNLFLEFPAVLLSLETGEVLSEFRQFVKPVESPVLSESNGHHPTTMRWRCKAWNRLKAIR